MDNEERMIRQIEADPECPINRAFYAEWLETRARRAAIVRGNLDGDCDHLIREDDRAWKVRMGYLSPVPEYFALTLEVPPAGIVKQVICSGESQITFNSGQLTEETFPVGDEDWRTFWQVVYHLPDLFSRREGRNGCWRLSLKHDGVRTRYSETSKEPSDHLQIVCQAIDRMVDGRFGFGGKSNSPSSIIQAAMDK